jgi:hypothetical protein
MKSTTLQDQPATFNAIRSIQALALDLLTLGLLTIPGIALFFALFSVGLLHSSQPILMYRGLYLAAFAATLQISILIAFWRARRYHKSAKLPTILAASALALAFNVTFLVVIPVTVDRSVTVFLLGQLANSPSGMKGDALRGALVSRYVDSYAAVDRRMHEQQLSGNVSLDGELYKLTPQGERFIKFSRAIGAMFGADLRYINGE